MARRDRRRRGAHSPQRRGDPGLASEVRPSDDDAVPVSPRLPDTEVESAHGIHETAASDSLPTAGSEVAPDSGAIDATGVTPATGAGPLTAKGAEVPVADMGSAMTRRERREANSSGAPSKRGAKGSKPKRTWLDWVLLSGVVLVSVALVAVVSGYAYVQYRFGQVTKVTVKHLRVAPVGAPFNVLLIGSDSRANVSGKDQNAYGTSSTAGGQRSDVIKIAHVVPATGQVSILSIPRDTVVKVAGDTSQIGSYNRINATYNNGPDQLVQTIEFNFGISIQHVVQLNFIGFRGAVDAIGGVNLNFPYPARDDFTGLNIATAGCQHVNGGYSLAVARSRHYQYYANGYWQSDGTSDFGRIQRQNAFLKALINQAQKQYNPLTLNAFIGSVIQGVTIDSTFTVTELAALAQHFKGFASSSLAASTLPTYASDSSEFYSLGAVLYVQEPQATQVISQFLGGPAPTALTPPPGPYGTVATTTTSPTGYGTGTGTPTTTAPAVTTTTIPVNFDPTPC